MLPNAPSSFPSKSPNYNFVVFLTLCASLADLAWFNWRVFTMRVVISENLIPNTSYYCSHGVAVDARFAENKTYLPAFLVFYCTVPKTPWMPGCTRTIWERLSAQKRPHIRKHAKAAMGRQRREHPLRLHGHSYGRLWRGWGGRRRRKKRLDTKRRGGRKQEHLFARR